MKRFTYLKTMALPCALFAITQLGFAAANTTTVAPNTPAAVVNNAVITPPTPPIVAPAPTTATNPTATAPTTAAPAPTAQPVPATPAPTATPVVKPVPTPTAPTPAPVASAPATTSNVSPATITTNAAALPLASQNAATNMVSNSAPPALIPPAPQLNVHGYVLMDAAGNVLAQSNMNQRMEPASLTKMMTTYVTFQALRNNQIHLTDNVRVPEDAWRTGGSRMFLKLGSEVPVDTLLQGVIVASGNDACVTLAEYIGGTEATFAQLMNQTAQRLGMTGTHFMDSTGLPNPDHYSTPYDMALLAKSLITDFPEYYHYFGQKWIYFNNIKQPNRNRLLWRDSSVDGLKTGHTDNAGYCLVASGKQSDTRLIAVIMGAPSDSGRADSTEALLNYGFRFFKTYKLFDANQAIAQARVWSGQKKMVPFGLATPLYVTVPVGQYDKLQATMALNDRLTAPIKKGTAYGKVNVTLNGQVVTSAPLVALEDDQAGGFISRIFDRFTMMMKHHG